MGVCHVILKGHGEHYTWKKVSTCLHNIIVGTMWLDHYGTMEIRNHKTNETCALTYVPCGWGGKNQFQINGFVRDAAGRDHYVVFGKWNDRLMSRPCNPDVGSREGTPTTRPRRNSTGTTLWRATPRPDYAKDMYNFTRFAMELNELNPELAGWLAPTDCRFRPDQRALEEGSVDRATDKKFELEEKQRRIRKEREARCEEWVPRWFRKSIDLLTTTEMWEFTDEYWDCRAEKSFSRCPDLF